MKKMLKQARRNICRAIYYWDNCPMDCRKDWRTMAQNALAMVALVLFTIAILSVILITL